MADELCDERHKELNRRMGDVEDKLADNLEKLYSKIEDLGKQMINRLPIWVTVVITVLSSTCVGLIVAIVR